MVKSISPADIARISTELPHRLAVLASNSAELYAGLSFMGPSHLGLIFGLAVLPVIRAHGGNVFAEKPDEKSSGFFVFPEFSLKETPMDQLEVWFAADEMIYEYGPGAILAADRHADAKLDQGDIAGFNRWTRILEAIRDLSKGMPSASLH